MEFIAPLVVGTAVVYVLGMVLTSIEHYIRLNRDIISDVFELVTILIACFLLVGFIFLVGFGVMKVIGWKI